MFIIDNKDPSYCLIQAVYRYYPVGFNLTNIQYPGFKHLNELIAQKHPLPSKVKNFELELTKKLKGYFISTNHEHPVPNYSFTIHLANKDYASLEHILHLNVNISLLVNYYTIYYASYVKHKNNYVGTTVLSLEEQIAEGKEKDLEAILGLLRKYFPDYYFIPHQRLFNLKVRLGTPFDGEYLAIAEPRPVFAYLFEDEGQYGTFQVSR
ncbi:hypothetical protein [Albibacterium profundi]|uniref:Uncharacterized protein n=1 Tax=Albibacterium profundi TaxID=3134906 RepID=A0ABV5CE70_9SPHI